MCASKVSFTEPRVQRFECAEGKKYTLHWDDDTPGMGLRVTNTGARSYVFEKRVHGHTRRVTIGDPRSWKLDDARKRARYLATLVDRDIDPKDEAAAERAKADAARLESQRHAHVVATVWQAYIEANSQKKKPWGERHLADHISLAHPGGEPRKKHGGKGKTTPGPLAPLMPLKLSELTSSCLSEWLKREANRRPTSAAQSYRLLRAFVRWAADVPEYKGIIPSDACTARDVRDQVPRSRAKEGDCLQREHLSAWFGEVRRTSNPIIGAYLQGLLLIGSRREELAELQWSDVEFEWGGSMTLRDKVEGERTIPLPPYMASLLKNLPRRNRWVFSSPESDSGRIVSPTKAHNAALSRAGLPHVSLHGLRRSFCTLSEWVETPVGIVAQIQGHKPSAIAEGHYKRRPLDLLRVWHEKLEAWILEQAGIAFAAAVPPARRLAVVSADGSLIPA